jgi:hypothetical protein
MRRLSLTLLVAILALPAAALAGRTTTGDGVFELRAGNGIFVLNGRGVLWGQMDKGAMRVTNVDPNGQQVSVSGFDKGPFKAPDDPNATIYQGTNLHFRITGGKYRIRFRGSSVDLTAIGVGTAVLNGSPQALTPGDYALDGGKWQPIAWTERYVAYGTQPPPPPTSP